MKKLIAVLVPLIIIMLVTITSGCTNMELPLHDTVTDFQSCLDAGNPAMESHPRQCMHEGVTYIEQLGPEQFINLMQAEVVSTNGQPIEGFEPIMFLQTFPGLMKSDFANVEAQQGVYVFANNEVNFEAASDAGLLHSAGQSITDQGMLTLLNNVANRMYVKAETNEEIATIVELLLWGIDEQAGIANPAAVFCEEQGGFTVDVIEPAGSHGYCSLPDGRICDQWPFFNSGGDECIELVEELPEPVEVSEEDSMRIGFLKVLSSPTYTFDGSNLEHTGTEQLQCSYCWAFTYTFESSHSGYGDRTDEVLAQVITPHEAVVIVTQGKVTGADLDGQWNMIRQERITR
ncbi:MAG: DUF333 domain-containing protein [Candidatus Aenigmatarchaeota archaeon]